MKAYLAAPLVNNRDSNLAKNIVQILKDLGCEILSEWVLWDNPNPNLDEKGIYKRDYNAIKSCDCLIADISRPSLGVGIEIMMAKNFRKKIICIYKNPEISNMVKGMPGITHIYYSNMHDLSKKLRSEITSSSKK